MLELRFLCTPSPTLGNVRRDPLRRATHLAPLLQLLKRWKPECDLVNFQRQLITIAIKVQIAKRLDHTHTPPIRRTFQPLALSLQPSDSLASVIGLSPLTLSAQEHLSRLL